MTAPPPPTPVAHGQARKRPGERLSDCVQRLWRGQPVRGGWALRPLLRLLAVIYGAALGLRHTLYRLGLRRGWHSGVPTIVVGNVVAGGAGKTPLTLALVQHLRARGWQPGIVTRGYGREGRDCRRVHPTDSPQAVGDEPLLLARAAGVPVFVAAQRVQAVRALLGQVPQTDIIICDDGLQHHALARDVNLCVFSDAGVGNARVLPAGPLREPWPRRASPRPAAHAIAPGARLAGIAPVDAVLHTGDAPPAGTPPDMPVFALRRQLAPFALGRDGRRVPLKTLRTRPVHAVAAIAHPHAFFAMLRAQGLTLACTQALPDHDSFAHWQPSPAHGPYAGAVLLCTEKDAAKLWPHCPQALAVPLQVDIAPAFFDWLERRLAALPHARPVAQAGPLPPQIEALPDRPYPSSETAPP